MIWKLRLNFIGVQRIRKVACEKSHKNLSLIEDKWTLRNKCANAAAIASVSVELLQPKGKVKMTRVDYDNGQLMNFANVTFGPWDYVIFAVLLVMSARFDH